MNAQTEFDNWWESGPGAADLDKESAMAGWLAAWACLAMRDSSELIQGGDRVICPGCGWSGQIVDLGEFGACPSCEYENGVEPYRLLTLQEILAHDDVEYTDVRLDLFVRAILMANQYVVER